MEEDFKKRGDACPRLLDLIPDEKNWLLRGSGGGGAKGLKASEEKDLELRLGPPGGSVGAEGEHSSALSLGFFSKASKTTTTVYPCSGAKRGFLNSGAETTREDQQQQQQQQQSGFVQGQSRAGLGKEATQWSNGTTVKAEQHGLERKIPHVAPGGTVGSNNSSQTRTASVPVVGWPPIRSFRKNLASTSAKLPVESANGSLEKRENTESTQKGLFVKINMDGIPIGRKVNLNAYDSYEKLSVAVEGLFQGLLEAQKDPSADSDEPKADEQVFTGLLDGTGEYTLLYEDTEGDKMLVGDVPWGMFVSTAKRLRVIKSSDLSALRLGAVCRKRAATEC